MGADRIALAHHEAGHAAMHLRLGMPFEYISIKPHGDHVGLLKPSPSDWRPDVDQSPASHRRMENTVLTLIAGPMAEARLRGCRIGESEDGGYTDSRLARELLLWFYPTDEITDRLEELVARAETIFADREFQRRHSALASALLREETIAFTGARRIWAGQGGQGLRGRVGSNGSTPYTEGCG